MYYRIFDIHPKSCEYKIILTLVAKILKSRVRRRAVSVQFLAEGCGFSTLVLSRTNSQSVACGNGEAHYCRMEVLYFYLLLLQIIYALIKF